MTFWLVIVLVFVTFASILNKKKSGWLKRTHMIKSKKDRRRGNDVVKQRHPAPPGPLTLPVVGSISLLRGNWFRSLTDLRARYGDVFHMVVGVRDIVVLNGWRTVSTALCGGTRTARQLAGRPDLHGFRNASEGKAMSFNGYSATWRMHRHVAERALARAMSLTRFIETTVDQEARLLLGVFIANGKTPSSTTTATTGSRSFHSDDGGIVSFDPTKDITRSIAHSIYTLCFGSSRRSDHGSSSNSDENEDFETIIRCSECIVRSHDKGSAVDFFPWAKWLIQSTLTSLDHLCALMLATTRRLTNEHRQTYRADVVRDVIDALIYEADNTVSGRQLGSDRVEMTVQEFIGAGFDILAAAVSWIVAYMAEYPDVQERVRREADAAAASTGPMRTPFAEAVVLEVLRHSCVVPLALPHSTIGDTLVNGT